MMRRLLLIAFLGVAGALPAAAQAEKPLNVITVTGEGEVSLAPDLAVLGAGVTTTGKTAREASEANARMMTTVMAALKTAGVEGKDIQTAQLSLYPLPPGKIGDARPGFRATNQVSVKLRDLTKVADVIDGLVAAGANDISGIQFVVSSPSKPLDQAREAAMADAKRKAEVYAKAANLILGAPVSITEEGSAVPGPMMMRTAKAEASTPISPGEQVQRISVSVSYELTR